MQRTGWIYLSLAVALLTILAVPIYLYNQPLGPSLDLDQPQAAVVASVGGVKTQLSSPLEQSSDETCGASGRVNILFLGQNLSETYQRGADAIRLIFVNYDTPSIASLSLPPELLVNTAKLEEVERTTLTMAFWLGKQPPPQGQPAALKQATEVIAQALLDDFGFTAEKYMTMNQGVFGQMIETLGGITVEVGVPVAASGEMGPFITGEQEMDSQTVLDYVRITGPGDLFDMEQARFTRQEEVVDGIYNALLDPDNILQLPSLIGDFYNLLVTDLQPKELRSLYCMLTEEKVIFRNETITSDMILSTSRGGEMRPDAAAISALVNGLASWTP